MIYGVDVQESIHILILIDLGGGDLLLDDLAEQAIISHYINKEFMKE